MSWTTSRARNQSVSTEYRFLRDHSVETLDRELPLVIERIREAGLAVQTGYMGNRVDRGHG